MNTELMMQLTINGAVRQTQAPNLSELLEELGVDARQVAVERQGAIVPKSAYGETSLNEGDAIEILRFIGGG